MFRLQTSGRARNDKVDEAKRFAREIAEYVNTKYPPVSVQVYSEVFENSSNIYWYSDYKDLATIQNFRAQLRSDQGYWARVFEGMDYFIGRNFRETLMGSA
jgi:hypothetical protein